MWWSFEGGCKDEVSRGGVGEWRAIEEWRLIQGLELRRGAEVKCGGKEL